MIYISWLIVGFTILQFIVALVNLIFKQKLPVIDVNKNEYNSLISVLIPARNEEATIDALLEDLTKQVYPNFEVLVFNDQSTDNTAGIVSFFERNDNRIKLIDSNILPDGWLGKNYACHSLANEANGNCFLFLDADVRIKADLLLKCIAFSQIHKLDLLSIFPKQIMLSPGEKATVPVMNYILLSLLPLILIYKTKAVSFSAANGQFMLFDADIYRKFLPHEKMKSNMVEDIEIARYFKKNKMRMACIPGDDSIQCRMYTGFQEAVNGFSKNVLHFFANSFALALLFWLISTFGFILIFVQFGLLAGILYVVLILITRIVISLVSRQNILTNLIYLVPQQIGMGVFIFSALSNKIHKSTQWKGRSIQ
jgi:glycosyltransferase involved in cell wall biosynthesis